MIRLLGLTCGVAPVFERHRVAGRLGRMGEDIHGSPPWGDQETGPASQAWPVSPKSIVDSLSPISSLCAKWTPQNVAQLRSMFMNSSYSPAPGESEFGGGPGLIPARRIRDRRLSSTEELWAVYASDPDSPDEPDPARVGKPESYAHRS